MLELRARTRLRSRAHTVRARLAPRIYRLLRPLARRLGFHLVRANPYSPIPELRELPPRLWAEPAPMPGVALDLDAQVTFVERELAAFVAEFDPPADPPGTADGYFLRNRFFGALDAELLYALIRHARPQRVLELGSGFSTLVTAAAADRNAAERAPVRHEVCDPHPSWVVQPVLDRIDLHEQPATAIGLVDFESLRENDILFIDTTHTVKAGGEVNYLMLEVLPRLASGVLVHVHDFFRPYEYPRELFERYGVYWQEQYLVQALLSDSAGWEVLLANHALARQRGERIGALVPSLDASAAPSSLWLRRRDPLTGTAGSGATAVRG